MDYRSQRSDDFLREPVSRLFKGGTDGEVFLNETSGIDVGEITKDSRKSDDSMRCTDDLAYVVGNGGGRSGIRAK